MNETPSIPRPHRRSRPAVRGAVLGTLGALVVATGASAHLVAHADGNDVSAPFDLRRVSLERRGADLRATVVTYDPLRARDFATGDAFLVRFDSRGDGRLDFTLRLEYYEGAYPYCSLYDANGFSRAGGVAVKGERSFVCTIPWSSIEATRHIRWRVDALSYGRVDRAPNQGWYSH